MAHLEIVKTIWPAEILKLPQVEFPVSGVSGHSLSNGEKQVTFFNFQEGITIPDHSHAAQWGYIVEGEMTLEIEGQTELFQSGDTYHIPAHKPHRTSFSRNSFIIDMGDDPQRYKVMK